MQTAENLIRSKMRYPIYVTKDRKDNRGVMYITSKTIRRDPDGSHDLFAEGSWQKFMNISSYARDEVED